MSAQPLTDADLDAIEARANAAPREHEASHPDELHPRTIVVCGRECPPQNDYTVAAIDGPAAYAVAELYGHAQEDVLALVAEVRRLRAEVERLQGEVVEARERLREERATTDAQTDQRDDLLRTLVACRAEVERLRP